MSDHPKSKLDKHIGKLIEKEQFGLAILIDLCYELEVGKNESRDILVPEKPYPRYYTWNKHEPATLLEGLTLAGKYQQNEN